MKSEHELLEKGELEVTGRLVDASNATLLAICSFDDQKTSVIYKPIAGERPLWDFTEGQLAYRERAAYLISEYGEFHVVPTTVLRDGPFGVGAVQQWIDIDEEVDLAHFYSSNNDHLRKLALFDAVVNNTDRKIGHLLPKTDGTVLGCDHGVTFHQDDKLRTVLWQWAGQKLTDGEISQLKNLYQKLESDHSFLDSLLTPTEISALVSRIQNLFGLERFPEPSKDWPSVPWPPF
ncbi:MAG: hypothetical protein RL381_816 [Actinomycetota bacterium]|jgi:uncharacterized repeat protein (TIGR03843 family)